MTTLPVRPLLAALALAASIAACTSGGPASSPSMAPSDAPPSAPVPTAVPGASDGATVPGGGGSSQPGTGGDPGIIPPGGGDPGTGIGGAEPSLVTPVAGLTNIHPVGAVKLVAAVNGRDLAIQVEWWSGVEPCNVLAGVDVARDGNTFTLTVNEGSGARGDVACIEIAVYKGTIVDLGELEPGDYTVQAFGEAAPITVTVAG